MNLLEMLTGPIDPITMDALYSVTILILFLMLRAITPGHPTGIKKITIVRDEK